jgi:hypothetical protein
MTAAASTPGARVRAATRFGEPSSTQIYFAKPVPNTLRGAHEAAHAEKPYSYGWRIWPGVWHDILPPADHAGGREEPKK